jgi:vitamin B12 transporter
LLVQQLGGLGSPTYLKLRGLRNADTAVLVDGLRLRDAAGTQADASGVLQDLTIAGTSRVEVLRGAGASLYGTGATGGVINLITEPGGGRLRGSVLVEGGSLGSVRTLARVSGSAWRERLDFGTGASHWNVMSGVDGRSPARNTSGRGQVTVRLGRMVTLTLRVFTGDSFGFVRTTSRSLGTLPAQGIVSAIPLSLGEEHRYESGVPIASLAIGGATFLPATYNPDSTRAGRFFSGAAILRVRPSERRGLTASYQNVQTTRRYGDGPAGPGTQPTGSNLSDYEGRIQTANAHADAWLGRLQQIDAGYEYEREKFHSRLDPPAPSAGYASEVTQRSHTLFAQHQLHLWGDRLRFAAGWRAQWFRLDPPSFVPANGAPLSGRTFAPPPAAQTADLSAVYGFRTTGTRLRAHAGRGYRAPSLYERFGIYFAGTSYSLYGDPALRPERSNSIDAGVDQHLWSSRLTLSANWFYTRLNEVILYDSSGAINALTDPLGRTGGYRNAGGGLARGVELHVTAAATRSLMLRGGYTLTDSRQQTPLTAGVWQTYEIPRHQFSLAADQRFTSRLAAFLSWNASSSYLASVSGRAFRFDGPTRLNAGINYRRPFKERDAVRLYVKGDNILNRTLFENGFRTPGATFSAGTQFEF